MSRVEHIFGPRESWGKGNEREWVEAGKRGDAPSDPLARATSPVNGGGKKKTARGGRKKEKQPVQQALREKKAALPGISGFVSIRCGGCHKIINTCLHEKRTAFNCKTCGHSTKLEAVRSIHMLCPRCGFKGNYRTNRLGEEIQMECLNCSMPVNFRRNARGDFEPEVEA